MYAYITFGNKVLYFQYFIVLAISLRQTSTIHDIIFIKFGNDSSLNSYISKYKHLLDEFNLTIINENAPLNNNQINNPKYKSLINNLMWDFYKFIPWKLTKYEKIIFLDSDMIVIKNIDHIFDHDYDFVYADGPGSPVNSGFYLLKPNMNIYNELINCVKTGNFTMNNGWFNMGRKDNPVHNAIQATQGLYYYFFVKSDKYTSLKVDRRNYNAQTIKDSHPDYEPYIIHFSGWTKKPNGKHIIKESKDLTTIYHNKWQEIFNKYLKL